MLTNQRERPVYILCWLGLPVTINSHKMTYSCNIAIVAPSMCEVGCIVHQALRERYTRYSPCG